jgi:hypothetical protein
MMTPSEVLHWHGPTRTDTSHKNLVAESRLQIYKAGFINISLNEQKIYNTHVNSPFSSSEFLQLSLH